MTAIDRTAYPYYRRTLSPVELQRYYTLTDTERAWVASVARGSAHVLCCSVLLKAAQHLGYFPELDAVPERIVHHLRRALDVPDTTTCFTITPRTRYTYHRHIRAYLSRTTNGRVVRHLAVAALVDAAQVHDHPADLINIAVEHLRAHNAELPAFSTLDRLTRRVRTVVNNRLAQRVLARLPLEHQERLLAMLAPRPNHAHTVFADLKRTAQQASYQHFDDLLVHLTWRDRLGSFADVLADVPPSKIQHLAAEAKALDAAEMQDRARPKQVLLLVCLIHRAQAHARDALVAMFRKRMVSFHKAARMRLKKLQQAHQGEIDRLLTTFTAVLDVLDDQPTAADALDRITAILTPAGGATTLLQSCEAMTAFTGKNYLPLVWHAYHSHRSLLFRMLDALELASTSQDTRLMDAVAWLKAHRTRTAKLLPATLDLAFAPEQWQRLIVTRTDKQPMLVRKHLEVCIFSCLAAELKTGDVAVARSDAYTDYRTHLVPWRACEPMVTEYCQNVGLPPTATGFVADLKARLTHAATLVDQAFPTNHDLTISAAGEPLLKRTARAVPTARAATLEADLLARMPDRHLLDIIAAVTRWTGCTRHFGPVAGTEPKLADPLADYARLVFAYGTNMGPVQAARHMRDAMSAHRLSYLNRRHTTSAALHAAQTDIINVYHPLTLPRAWGDGSRAAADGTIVDLAENNPLAEYHFRYRRRGGVAYHHVADSYIAIFSHFIPCGVWEAMYIIEGLLQNTSDLQPTMIHADTQGQSTPVFALAHLLGIELLPRIRNWKDLILYKADAAQTFDHIEPLFGGGIDWALIKRHWQDMLQVVLSIRAGTISSAMLLRKLGHDSKKNKLYQVFREVGRVIRTLFLLRYISDQPLRVVMSASTNKVEAYHGFQQWLTFGREGKLMDVDPEEAEKLIKYADVLANAVILHNVYDMTKALKGMLDDGSVVEPADLATLSPYITRHIQRFGTYTLSRDDPPVFDDILGWDMPPLQQQETTTTEHATEAVV